MAWYSRHCADCSRPMDKKQKEIGKEGRLWQVNPAQKRSFRL